jgi:Lon protease-like protein
MGDAAVLPMFPLGTVLFPSLVLPLHVFEPRYRRLVQDCLAGEPEFGVVLIERGSEVGGGDVRTHVGTVARIVEAAELPDGRWALTAVGMRRTRVTSWLEDDPYPRAEVQDWEDAPADASLVAAHAEVVVLLRRSLGLQAEMGGAAAPATVELADDVLLAGYQACALAPIGPLDQQRLLAAPTPGERVATLRLALVDAIELLEAQLAGG